MTKWSMGALACVLAVLFSGHADPAAAQTFDVRLSLSPTRANPVALNGATVSGNIYVFTSPESGVARVRFFLDDPAMTGAPVKTENASPHDFAGTAPDLTALPYSSGQLSNGSHTITAAIDLTAGGTQVRSATFTVSNSAASTYSLLVSTQPNRANPVTLQGATVLGNIYVFTSPETGVVRVRFFLDDPAMAGAPVKTEGGAPHDFAGTAPDGTALPYGSGQLSNGGHTITAAVDLVAGGTQVVSGTFTVSNSSSSYSLVVSSTPNRANPVALQGVTVAGAIYVFTSPESGVSQVRFFVDDPAMGGAPFRTENHAAYDLAGTAQDGTALPFDTAQLTEGAHTVTTAVVLAGGGTQVTSASFTVDNTAPALLISPNSVALSASEGGSASAVVNLNTNGGTATYTLSGGAPWLSVTPGAGSTPAALNVVANSTGLPAGTYAATVTASAAGFQSANLAVSFAVGTEGCSPVPCEQILVDLPYELEFNQNHGQLLDGAGIGTGFTYVDPPGSGSGYLPQNLAMDVAAGVLRITTTAGLAHTFANAQDNAIAVGIDAPSQITLLSTTLINPPAGTGSFEQAGLWFGTDQDNYVKLIVISTPSGPQIEYRFEQNGESTPVQSTGVPNLTGSTVHLALRANPVDRTIGATYRIDDGLTLGLGSIVAPPEFFSFDGAGIDPRIGTRSFGGIFASHRNGPSPLVYTFGRFAAVPDLTPPPPPPDGVAFNRSSFEVPMPTSIVWGPDDRLYVTELFGTIHAITLDANKQPIADQVITTLGARLALGITIDPNSTPGNVILWVAHSSPSLDDGQPNSSMVTRLSGPGFTIRQDVITGLPRAIANHAINSIHFGPDGKLYIALGGNTGAGAPNQAATEFGTMEEQPLSAAILVADVFNPSFDGSCHNASNIFGPPPCDVVPYATGLRNSYDFVFHSNGSLYATDNGLGVVGTYPPSPSAPCFGLADPGVHNPGEQPDLLLRVEAGKYYGHPNPYRNECVFKDGSFQGVAPLPNYAPPMYTLGSHLSSNGMIEYTASAFCGDLRGDLLIANYSIGDDIIRIRLSPNGLSVISAGSLVGGFNDPLPLALGPDGTVYVGELSGSVVTALTPVSSGCWATKQPLPDQILDAGGAAVGGKLYVVAGKTAAGHQTTLYVYDPVGNTWSLGPNLPGVGVENPAVTALGGKLYVFGGSTQPFSGATTNAAVFNPVTLGWSSLAPMPTARGGATAQAIGSLIYVVGGLDGTGASLATMDVYNPATNTWSGGVPMSTRRDNPGSAALGGKLYIFGGRTRNADGSVINGTLNTVEAYDPATGTWTPRAPMPTGRRTMAVGTLDGRAQVMGGEATAEAGTFPQNEEYDPVTDTWGQLRQMITPRHGTAAGTIGDTVYVVGGGVTAGTSFSGVNEAFSFELP